MLRPSFAHRSEGFAKAGARAVGANGVPDGDDRVTGGAFYLGSRLPATNFVLGSAATLSGNGEVLAPATLSGTVSPGSSTADIGNLSFSNRVTFNSATYRCHAATDTSLDRISATAKSRSFGTPPAAPLANKIVTGQLLGGASDPKL